MELFLITVEQSQQRKCLTLAGFMGEHLKVAATGGKHGCAWKHVAVISLSLGCLGVLCVKSGKKNDTLFVSIWDARARPALKYILQVWVQGSF